MDNLRLFLWLGLGLLLFMSWQTWQLDYATPLTARAPAAESPAPAAARPAPPDAELPALPEAALGEAAPATGAKVSAAAPAGQQLIAVRTDVLDVLIDLDGGNLVRASLPQYPVHKDQPDVPVVLLSPEPDSYYVLRSGLRAAGGPEPGPGAVFSSAARRYELAPGADELLVPLRWDAGDGLVFEKRYRFRRGQYAIALEQRVENGTAQPYQAAAWLQIQRRHQPPKRSMFNVDSYSFIGPVFYDGEKYQKLAIDDLTEQAFTATAVNGWLASIQHHFLGAIIPPAEQAEAYTISYRDGRYSASVIDAQVVEVAPGERHSFAAQLFLGPKLQSQLRATAEGLELTVDYGRLTLLAEPLFWVLEKVYGVVGNWGWTIIIVTLLIKLLFYKLTETSGRSMAKMRNLAPRLKALQERYKDDREALSRAMMDLYKREKVNPAAGCLPMLIQIPFFIAFYWVLLESVEMRQAPFMLWITDLSSRDPYFVLPLLMGAAMWFQQKLNPAPPDPMQAKVMNFLPVIFTAMFAFFPAGLVLYWLTNSLLSMLQQWRINKVLGAA